MWKPMLAAGLVLTGLGLAGCDKIKRGPPVPQIDVGQPTLPKPTTTAADPSVPLAGSVLTPAHSVQRARRGSGPRACRSSIDHCTSSMPSLISAISMSLRAASKAPSSTRSSGDLAQRGNNSSCSSLTWWSTYSPSTLSLAS